MNQPVESTHNQNPMLAFLLAMTMMGALLASSSGSLTTLPGWVGGVISMGALFGTLLTFWHSGALRARFLVFLVAAFAAAALAGWLLSGQA